MLFLLDQHAYDVYPYKFGNIQAELSASSRHRFYYRFSMPFERTISICFYFSQFFTLEKMKNADEKILHKFLKSKAPLFTTLMSMLIIIIKRL